VTGQGKIGRVALALLSMVLFPLHHPPLLLPLLPFLRMIPHLRLLMIPLPLLLLEDAMFAQLLARSAVELAQRREILLTVGARNVN